MIHHGQSRGEAKKTEKERKWVRKFINFAELGGYRPTMCIIGLGGDGRPLES